MPDVTLLGESLLKWLLAIGVTLALVAMTGIARAVLRRRLGRLTKQARIGMPKLVLKLVQATRLWLVLPLAIFVGSQILSLPPRVERIVVHVAIVSLLLQSALWANRVLLHVLSHKVEQRLDHDAAGATTLAVVGFLGRLVLWSVVSLLILGNLGFDVTGLVAGLGIGGIAVALAAQNILGDLFASLSIALDKPFLIGDFIIVGDKMGTVEHIGIKTTRIRSLGGEQIVFANTDLLKNAILNYKRMRERRVVFTFGVLYETDESRLATIPVLVRQIIESQRVARFDRAHFKEFGDFALIFEVVYYVLDPDHNVYMDVQQAINLALFRELAKANVEFAYPTQRLYVTAPATGKLS